MLSAALRVWIRHATHRHSHRLLLNATAQCQRANLTSSPDTTSSQVDSCNKRDKPGEDPKTDGCFYLDSVFPIRLGTWECVPQLLDIFHCAHLNLSFRHSIVLFKEKALVEKLENIFKEVNVHGFEVSSVDPRLASLQTAPTRIYLMTPSELKTAVSSSTFNIPQCLVPSLSAHPSLRWTPLTLLLLK